MSYSSPMAMPMGPPMTPGYSLRVQLFAPNAHSASDTPIRCFRVVTSPDATLREFCQEAIRIHTINYGESISIKKCQDDQLFDVTQSDLIGPLFQNAATIRVIQASKVPSIRDSVPPTSALRYNPGSVIGHKRDRSGSPVLDGSGFSNQSGVNKRQRVFELDPDQPLPSSEEDRGVNGNGQSAFDDYIVPDSQQEDSFIVEHGHPARHPVRLSAVPESSASPRPYFPTSTDRMPQKSAVSNLRSPHHETPILPPTNGLAPRRKSATYHIPRPEERGTSVSTAATTPLDADRELELPTQNGSLSSPARKTSDTISSNRDQNTKNGAQSRNESSIYDEIPSDQEVTTGLRRTKAAMKVRNSPRPGSSGSNRGDSLETPPTGTRRRSSELPLTPDSRTRNEIAARRSQNGQGSARSAAAEAAEQRKREAEETRRSEEQKKTVEELRLKDKADAEVISTPTRQQKEHEQKERKEKETADRELAKRATLFTRGERLRKEKEEKEKKETAAIEQERTVEALRQELAARKKESEIAAANQQKLEEEKRVAEQHTAAEAEELQKKTEKKKAAEDLRKSREKAETLSRKKSTSSEPSAPSKHDKSIPDDNDKTPLSKSTPSKPQSSTPFIPRGRSTPTVKSALKGSSPEVSKKLPEIEKKGVGLEDQMPLPKRRVSFMEGVDEIPRPAGPVTKALHASSPILPNSKVPSTPKPVASNIASSRNSTPILPGTKLSSTILPPARTSTPKPKASSQVKLQGKSASSMQPPTSNLGLATSSGKSGEERSTPPVTQTRILPPPRNLAKRIVAPVIPAKVSQQSLPSPAVQSSTGETPSVISKGKSKSAEPQPVAGHESTSSDEAEDSDESESDDEDSAEKPSSEGVSHNKLVVSSPDSVKAVKPGILVEKREDQDVEMAEAQDNADDGVTQSQDEEADEDAEIASHHSSPRESRSPVVFNQHSMSQNSLTGELPPRSAQSPRATSPDSVIASDEEESEEDDDEEEENGDENKENEGKDDESESQSESEKSDAEDVEDDQASPKLPRNSGTRSAASSLPKNQRTYPSSPSSMSTQEEIDQQLTSSVYEALRPATQSSQPPPASSNAKPKSTPHTMKNGASLTSLRSHPEMLSRLGKSKAKSVADGRQNMVKAKFGEEELSSDQSSDSNSDSSASDSDDSNGDIPAVPRSTANTQGKATVSDASDSDDAPDDNNIGQARNAAVKKPSQSAQKKKMASRAAGKDMRRKKTGIITGNYSFGRAP